MSLPRASTAITLDLITSAGSSEQRLTTYSCRAQLWWPSKGAAICVGQVFMSCSWRGSLAGEDLATKTDGLKKKEETIKLGRPCWMSPYGWMNYRRLAKLNVRMQHIMSDWSFLYWLEMKYLHLRASRRVCCFRNKEVYAKLQYSMERQFREPWKTTIQWRKIALFLSCIGMKSTELYCRRQEDAAVMCQSQ